MNGRPCAIALRGTYRARRHRARDGARQVTGAVI